MAVEGHLCVFLLLRGKNPDLHVTRLALMEGRASKSEFLSHRHECDW